MDHSRLSDQFNHIGLKAATLVLALSVLTGLSCGKRGLPLPPEDRIPQRVQTTGFQRGNRVILQWRMPEQNAAAGRREQISRVDIYRSVEPASGPIELTEEEFASRSSVIAAIPVTEADFGSKTMTYADTISLGPEPVRLRYAVRFVNAAGQRAGLSNVFVIQPATVAGAPTSLSTTVKQEAIELTWAAPEANADGSRPANLLGYNVYRADAAERPASLLNKTPAKEPAFTDRTFEFGKEYSYFVRAVSVGSEGSPVESSESNIASVIPRDIFAPSAPTAITLASTSESISIFFATNPEPDVAGYRIYRSADRGAPIGSWQLVSPDLLTTNTFTDRGLKPGATYFYYIRAIDTAGNVSDPSEIVSETVQE